jgi:hypothetical protein
MCTMVICIEFERLKRLLDSTQQRRLVAMENADLQGAEAASEKMMKLSELMFEHALTCEICNGTITVRRER